MKLRKLRNRIGAVAAVGIAALSATSMLAGGVASAAITIPAYPTIGVYPSWLTSDNSVSHLVRGDGSDTTLALMQDISDLYNQAGLYGCTLVGSGAQQNSNCDQTTGGSPNFSDVATTDTVDNFDSTETLEGTNDIGSGNGQKQLCGSIPTPDVIDFARSSKPIASGIGCTTLAQTGFAKDSVPVDDIQNINPAEYGTASGYAGQVFKAANQTFTPPAFPAGGIGPVAAGWLPGDPTNCTAGGSTPCSGTAFTNVVGGTGSGATSVAYRLWCATDSTRITDWGQLTNLAANGPGNGGVAQSVGSGAPIGVPIRIIGINSGSGTVAAFYSFANAGQPTGGCTGSPYNPNAASGPNPLASDGFAGNLEISLENNASQIGDFAAADWPNDPADQAVDIATSLYFMSNGIYSSNPNAHTVQLEPGTGTVPAGDPTAFLESQLQENGVTPSIAAERANTYPTSRTLFNIYNTASVKASTAGFINWICDASTDSGTIPKEKDNLTGVNYDLELTNLINGSFGFSRLDDSTTELTAAKQTPADGINNPNAACDAQVPVTTTSGVATVTDSAGNVPSSVASGWAVSGVAGSGIPAGDTVASVSGATITLTSAPTATGSIVLYFPHRPPVLAITDPTH